MRRDVGGSDVGLYLLKAPDIAGMLAANVLDVGVTGDEWLLEHGLFEPVA